MRASSGAFFFCRLDIWQRQRRLLQPGEQFLELQNIFRPVPRRVEPRESQRKCRIVPTSREPGIEMEYPHRSQRFYQDEFAQIERMKGFVTFDDFQQLLLPVGLVSREQHPDILDRRPGDRVVEIDEMGPVVTP